MTNMFVMFKKKKLCPQEQILSKIWSEYMDKIIQPSIFMFVTLAFLVLATAWSYSSAAILTMPLSVRGLE